jgi:hypothetical protein
MPAERRNLYRLLYVQPEAPEAVIKAAYRALMSTLRGHPDLGGSNEVAARLNTAYETLSDPVRRRAYDLSLRRPRRGAPNASVDPPAPWRDRSAWLADRCCPFCDQSFSNRPKADTRCTHCDAPLCPAPTGTGSAGELIGRRRAERFARDMSGTLRLPGVVGDLAVRLRDLSMSGLSLTCARQVPIGTTFRVITSTFDAVAVCVAASKVAGGYAVHGRLLTLQLIRTTRGVFVNERA